MKKLTAGIFTVLVSLVSANSANAAIATQGYVDQEVGKVSGTVSTLTQTVETNKTDAATATKAVADDLAAYKTQADSTFMDAGEVDSKIESAVTGTDGILKNYSTTEEMEDAIATAKSGAEATAAADATSKANAAQAAAEATAKGYTDDKVAGLDADSVGTDGSYIKLVSQADGKLSATAQAFVNAAAGIKTGETNAPTAGAVFDYVESVKSEIDGDTAGALGAAETAQATAEAAQGEVDALETVVANNKSATDTAIADITKDNGTIDTKVAASAAATKNAYEAADTQIRKDFADADSSLKTELEGKITAANTAASTAASTAESNAKKYTDDEIAALNLNDLSRVPAECAEASKWCVLTSNGTNYYWEVIVRGTAEDPQPTGSAIPAAN